MLLVRLLITANPNSTHHTRGGHFTRYLKPHPNPTRKTRTEIRTEVAKYPNGFKLGDIEYPNPNG